MIHLKELAFAYERQQEAIHQVDLAIQPGEFVVICGKSGCGKSTLLRILNGLIPELYPGTLTGNGTVFGKDFFKKEFNDYVKEIGVVFQNPKTQFFTNDVYSELAFAMENYGISPTKMKKRIKDVTQELSLNEFLSRSMFQLSGGQKQLVAFASASMLHHQLFLLDEPSSNLDKATIRQLTLFLKKAKKQKMTVIVCEHRLAYLTNLADRYLVMDQGRIIRNYTKDELLTFSKKQIRTLGLRALHETELQPHEKKNRTNNQKQATLSIENLRFHYRKQADEVTIPQLTIHSGEITGIVGNNGAGKTTFCQLLTGLLKPQTGSFTLNNKKQSAKQLTQESFVVMQDVNLQLFFETVEKEIRTKATHNEQFQSIVSMLDLEQLVQRHPQSLSGGEKQRVAIASALLSGKKIVIFDEPTSGLDVIHMEEVSKTLRLLCEKNVFVLVITHDDEFLHQTCDRMLQFEQGTIIADDYIN